MKTNIKKLSNLELTKLLNKHGQGYKSSQNKNNSPLKALRKELYRRNAENRKVEKEKAEENRLRQIETIKKMNISESFRSELLKDYEK